MPGTKAWGHRDGWGVAPPLVFSSLDLLTGRTFVRLGFCYQEKEREALLSLPILLAGKMQP
jgi:hypothetical protein